MEANVVALVRARLGADPRVNVRHHPLALSLDHGDLIMEGELESVAAKKLALEIAAGVPQVGGIIDRLRVIPSTRMTDGEILTHVLRALSAESGLQTCGLTSHRGARVEHMPPSSQGTRGQIDVRSEDGVVTLDGDVPSLTQKRLAEVLVWWVPGVRDVVNGLGISPPEEDSDDDITDALKMVLEKDPLLKGLKISVRTENRVVTLLGTVNSEEQQRAAETDGWCLFGVDRVVNELRVEPLRR
jgi:osmotically-inducible protein OsmY